MHRAGALLLLLHHRSVHSTCMCRRTHYVDTLLIQVHPVTTLLKQPAGLQGSKTPFNKNIIKHSTKLVMLHPFVVYFLERASNATNVALQEFQQATWVPGWYWLVVTHP